MSREDQVIPNNKQQPGVSKPYLDRADIVVIGNGIAGLTAAIEARSAAPDKRIVMITDQIHPTINTPALKQFAIAKLTREQLLAYPSGTERRERIHIVTARVEEIHANSKYVTLNGNRGFGYDKLLIATGSKPSGLSSSIPGYNFDGVMTLHRLQDYMDLRRRLPEISEAVVIGGGVLAIETVMGLLHWGIHVHWFIRGNTFMSHTLDKEASDMILETLRRSKVEIHLQTEAVGVVGRIGVVAGVVTNHQEMIPCQLVIACTGTNAVTALAQRCSLPMRHNKKGIMVDDQLRTSVPDIYAAGDVAALKNPQTGNYEPRAVWYAAISQARTVGPLLAGRDDQPKPFGVQWHATHLGELSMLTVGDPMLTGDKVTTLVDKSQGGYRRMALVDDRLVGYLALGSSQLDSLAIKRIVDEGLSVRDIKKELLQGNLDVREYFSRKRSQVAQGMLNPSALAALTASATSQSQYLPATVLPSPIPTVRQTESLPAACISQQQESLERATDALQRSRIAAAAAAGRASNSAQPPLVQEEETSPFTGSLPPINQPMIEEISPFTGNLPTIERKAPSRAPEPAVKTTSSSLPDWQTKRNTLWAYVSENEDKTQGQSQSQQKGHSSGSLWSYAGKGSQSRTEKRR